MLFNIIAVACVTIAVLMLACYGILLVINKQLDILIRIVAGVYKHEPPTKKETFSEKRKRKEDNKKIEEQRAEFERKLKVIDDYKG